MSPRTVDQWNEIRREKRQIILVTALELFANKGYHETTISLIAKEAEISKGLIYNYFESKESLLYEIIANGMNELVKDLEINPEKGLTREELIRYIDITFKKIKENTRFYQLFFSLILQPQVFGIFQEKFMKQILPLLELLVHYYREKGEKYPRAKAHLFGATLDGIGMDYIADPVHFPLEEIRGLFTEMFT